ncbi:hypothetical protein P7K49_000826 [Saguinus oedipus]|uniref:Uncharacterized protein n=1 Tax=Saguinus oedipus TaxID=9490 RepID=A0ABQ9WD86_SAGOE|nr:hypothetical protein P7K49_000826 [Saguinus oedipus]
MVRDTTRSGFKGPGWWLLRESYNIHVFPERGCAGCGGRCDCCSTEVHTNQTVTDNKTVYSRQLDYTQQIPEPCSKAAAAIPTRSKVQQSPGHPGSYLHRLLHYLIATRGFTRRDAHSPLQSSLQVPAP